MNALPPTFRLEPLVESNLAAVLKIETETNAAAWSEKSFRNELDHPHGIFRVALVDGQVAGYGGVWLVIDEAHITTLAVDEKYRRQGIGRAIMNELLRLARDRGMTCSTLEVRAGNAAALKLYDSMGYRIAARRRGYYPDNREDAVVMWLYDLGAWRP